ncbi:MAG: VanW family protein [Pyrinomonadaceae bacterium]
MTNRQIERPHERSKLRKALGSEYYVLKRRLKWFADRKNFACVEPNTILRHSVFRHRSMLLRPLKEVEMYLQHNKITNLRLAIEKIDSVVIRPGEIFSIWRVVGRPTASRGFLEGLVLNNGKIEKGIGGGLCHLGNLLYWMALHSPLTVAERYRHSFDVFPDVNRTIPFACGATLAYNYIDLQLRNDTNDSFQIKLWLDDEYLNGELLAVREPEFKYEIFETDHLIKTQIWGGHTRHNRIWKRATNLHGETHEELVAENHAIMMGGFKVQVQPRVV